MSQKGGTGCQLRVIDRCLSRLASTSFTHVRREKVCAYLTASDCCISNAMRQGDLTPNSCTARLLSALSALVAFADRSAVIRLNSAAAAR